MIPMPKKILVVTVGGSCEPIVNAVGSPPAYDFVYFVCSSGKHDNASERQVDGKGRPCGKAEGAPSIVQQTGLEESRYEKVLFDVTTEIDDLPRLYHGLKRLASAIEERFPAAQVTANYSGGTKSMSAALVLAAIDAGWNLQLNKGMRGDVVKIKAGDVPVLVATDGLNAERNSALFQEAFSHYNYSMAKMVADSTLQQLRLIPKEQTRWLEWGQVAHGLNLWDSFFYKEAREILAPVARYVARYLPFLGAIASGKRGAGYCIVLDLILNAERCAHRERFDDGVSRLYRALELLAQARLREEFGLETGRLDINDPRIPEGFKKEWAQPDEKGLFKVPLMRAYELLLELGDPFGREFDSRRDLLQGMLTIRNGSFLAHGFEPVDGEDFARMHHAVKDFVEECMKLADFTLDIPSQLPRSL